MNRSELMRNATPADIRLGLERVSKLCFYLGNPQDELKVVHITGTNGKGSVGAYITNVLILSGYRVGWFSTPAVTDECIRVIEPSGADDNKNIAYNYQSNIYNKLHKQDLNSKAKSDVNSSIKNISNFFKPDTLQNSIDEVEEACQKMISEGEEEPSVFEEQTALAYLYFYKKEVDIAVIEVGMGGATDATNIIKKNLLSVITNIGLDHQAFLGNTIEDIARQKAGIIKPGCPVVFMNNNADNEMQDYLNKNNDREQNIETNNYEYNAQDRKVIRNIIYEEASRQGSRVYSVDTDEVQINDISLEGTKFIYDDTKYEISMLGRYQVDNAALAIQVLRILKDNYPDICGRIDEKIIAKGLPKAKLPGRLEVLDKNPYIIYDGAHNPAAATALRKSIEDILDGRNIYAICGVYKDKAYREILDILYPVISAISPTGDRGLPEDELLDAWNTINHTQRSSKPGRTMRSVSDAVDLFHYKLSSSDPESVILIFGSLSLRRSIKKKL